MCPVASSGLYNKANIFLGLIEYELNSLRGAEHRVDYISVHIRFDLERYLLNIAQTIICPGHIYILPSTMMDTFCIFCCRICLYLVCTTVLLRTEPIYLLEIYKVY